MWHDYPKDKCLLEMHREYSVRYLEKDDADYDTFWSTVAIWYGSYFMHYTNKWRLERVIQFKEITQDK